MAEFLLEILSEEIPARMQLQAAGHLKRVIKEQLIAFGLEFVSVDSFVTPRRLTVVVLGLPARTPNVRGERKGPRTDASEQAVAGFKHSLPKRATLEERSLPKGTFFFATWEGSGRDTRDVIAEFIPKALQTLPWPKSMRWGRHAIRWVRPIHSLMAVFDGEGVPIQFGPFIATAKTKGHRYDSGKLFSVANFEDYKSKLLLSKVILDPAERQVLILAEAKKLAEAEGLLLDHDSALLNEVTGLVEWPNIFIGSIDKVFMDLPAEVLITSMKLHQRYFPCLDSKGNLANRFIFVANMGSSKARGNILAGNERVLRARLSDAKFFWDQDCRVPLAEKVAALKDRVFHAKLGSVREKVARMESLAEFLAQQVPGADAGQARRAAHLAKADLSSGMVGEFADLQGVMGQYYALNDGETIAVAEAIAEHYAPKGPSDSCPSAPIAVCVALADKIDTLVSFFAIDEKPTGSKDPFALRRAALGAVRLILENRLRVALIPLFEKAHGLLGVGPSPANDLLIFFADRFKIHLKERRISHDRIDAVFAIGGEDDLVRMFDRVDALMKFLGTEDGENLLIAYRRASNILKKEEKRDGNPFDGLVDKNLFVQSEEIILGASLARAGSAITNAISNEEFLKSMKAVAELRGPVDDFFEKVTVNVKNVELRKNRLKLLHQIRSALDGVADFSKIEG